MFNGQRKLCFQLNMSHTDISPDISPSVMEFVCELSNDWENQQRQTVLAHQNTSKQETTATTLVKPLTDNKMLRTRPAKRWQVHCCSCIPHLLVLFVFFGTSAMMSILRTVSRLASRSQAKMLMFGVWHLFATQYVFSWKWSGPDHRVHANISQGNQPIKLTCMSLESGRKLENLEKTHAGALRTNFYTEKPPLWCKPGTFLVWGNRATALPYLNCFHHCWCSPIKPSCM